MSDRKREDKSGPDRLDELERQADEVRRHVADLQHEADKTLEEAEELEEKRRELDAEDKEIRRKANEPIGFPPPLPKKGQGKD